MIEALKRILTITDNHPPLGKEWLPSKAQAMCDGMQEIHELALDAILAVERNADRDTRKAAGIDWAKVAEYLVSMARIHKSLFWGQLWRTLANAIQAGIAGKVEG